MNRTTNLKSKFVFSLVFVAALLSSNHAADAEDIRLTLKVGTTITVDAPPQSIDWTTVRDDGQLAKRRVRLGEIKELKLLEIPSSGEVQRVKQLMHQLGDSDYNKREDAEKQLKEAEVGGPYLRLIRQQQNHPVFEIRYRINRIIAHLEEESEEEAKPAEFDRLELNSGVVLKGDAGTWEINCKYRGSDIVISRDQLRTIASASEIVRMQPTAIADAAIETQVFQLPGKDFYTRNQTEIDFETDALGFEMKHATNVNDLFINKGIRFAVDVEGVAYMSTPTFAIKYPGIRTGGKCISTLVKQGNYERMFKDRAEITFCVPDQPTVPAGVHEFGIYAARVSHSRDLIMEAYSAEGNLLATVESGDTQCVFLGVKSNELIARIRILMNPYLFRLDRTVDEDYALDNVCFSQPKPVYNTLRKDKVNTVRMKNGDLLNVTSLEFNNQQAVRVKGPAFEDSIEIDLADISAINQGGNVLVIEEADAESETPTKARWMAILKDRSLIAIEPGETFSSTLFNGLQFTPNEIAGLNCATQQVRMPLQGDFSNGENVVVFPTCRIPTSRLKFSSRGFNWDSKDKKILQKVNIKVHDPTDDEDIPEETEDPTPQYHDIDFKKTSDSDIPTVWFSQPRSRQPGTGLLRLKDNQQIVLNGSAGFKIKSTSSSGIRLANGNAEAVISWDEVVSLEFPFTDD